MTARFIITLLLILLAGCTNAGGPGPDRPIPEWKQELGASFYQQSAAQTANPQPDTDYIPTGMDSTLAEETIKQYRTIEDSPEKQSGINLNVNEKKK
ncbi:hypothetical protein [Oleidesulfovibrio sp.]|uniref:hypothetical protein n=1 Tax=Oleidesulfovibrio sp. TaxID=2909707 RepID=UPI003A8594CC